MYSPLVKYLARPLAYLAPLIEISIMFMGMKVRIRIEARIRSWSRLEANMMNHSEYDLKSCSESEFRTYRRFYQIYSQIRVTVSPEFRLQIAVEKMQIFRGWRSEVGD